MKIIYKNDDRVLSVLGVKGIISIKISDFINGVDTLYKQLNASPELLTPLARLKINQEHIDKQLALLEEVKNAYSNYSKEKGESQQATKDKALSDLVKWVREFYAIAKIALEDQPQLLESIGKFVRS